MSTLLCNPINDEAFSFNTYNTESVMTDKELLLSSFGLLFTLDCDGAQLKNICSAECTMTEQAKNCWPPGMPNHSTIRHMNQT